MLCGCAMSSGIELGQHPSSRLHISGPKWLNLHLSSFFIMIGNKILKILALLGILILLAAPACSQMNRDTPFLASKIPAASENSLIGQGRQSLSPVVISTPFNAQASSDLYLVADAANTTCNQASFILTLTPSPSGSSGYQAVKVRVMENRMGTPTAVAELTILLPASGGSLHQTIGFASAASASGSNEITLEVDPDRQVAETDERNNTLAISAACRS